MDSGPRSTTEATLAFNYFRSQQVDHAKRTAREALQAAQQDPDPVLLYSVHTILGIVYSQDDDPKLSQQAREQALQYAREAQAPGLQALALGNLADYELRSGNYARALEMSTQSLALAHETGDISTEILARHNSGIAQSGLRKLE